MRTNFAFNGLISGMKFVDSIPLAGGISDSLVGFAIFFKDKTGAQNVLFLENTISQSTRLSAQSAKYPTELGFNQTEFKYKEPTEVRINGVISRKGTGVAGVNFSISSLALENPLQDKTSLIRGTLKDLDYLIANNVLCEVWALNGGKRSYMTLTGAEMVDDLEHKGLFEVNLTFVEVQELILEPEISIGALAKKIQTGICQVISKII